MKNKFLALAAFVTAVLGGAILSAPASAQIAQGSGPNSTINVTVSVPEILYLRTITTANVAITPADLVGTSGAAGLTAVSSSTPPAYQGSGTSSGATVDTTSPFSVGATPVTKTITSAYVVFSNSPTGTYEVAITPGTFTGPSSNTLAVGVNASDVSSAAITAEGLSSATAKDIILDVPLSATAPAGSYTGTLAVEAFRPN
ncbi:hypothetical protein [uncultured Nostoc sp.]|uniref:hypothetical protein n=1 Tax=uncultured Nostoc sp. TaxID=340711 RepID=UPI0035CC0884